MSSQKHLTRPSTLMPAMSADAIPIRWVEELFSRLAAVLGKGMADLYAGADPEIVKSEWAEALAGYSVAEIHRGLAATRTNRFAPNLPEFLHRCRPALDPEVAWHEAVKGMAAHSARQAFAWTHVALYWAAAELAFELRTQSFAQCRKRWTAVLEDQFARGAWPPVRDPTLQQLAAPEGARPWQ